MVYTKKEIRQEVLRLRSSLTISDNAEKSSKITERLVNLKEFGISSLIMCYTDFKNEVQTGIFINECFRLGKRVAVPLILNDAGGQREMSAFEICDLERDLKPGFYGIREPVNCSEGEIDLAEIDLVVVPGVAFDLKRNRRGYGAGYYDRFLKKLKCDCPKVGIAFELQVYDHLPVESHDIPLDMVITEERIIL